MKLLQDVLTSADNKSFDHGRILSFTSFAVYFILAGAGIVMTHAWDPLNFAGGVSAMAVGFGIHIKLNE